MEDNWNRSVQVKLTEKRSYILDKTRAQAAIVSKVARTFDTPIRDVEMQLLLHLPRLMDNTSFPDTDTFVRETERLAREISRLRQPYLEWQEYPSQTLDLTDNIVFAEVPEHEAIIIHERFHYLASFRCNSTHFGLRTHSDNRLVSLLTLSPFDLDHIAAVLPNGVTDEEIGVVSRVYSFDWAPQNAISYLMGHVHKWLKYNKPNLKMLITYVNPNLGFTGASLRAANWVPFGQEHGTRYCYLDGWYKTDRQLNRDFHTADPVSLQSQLKNRFQVSRIQLDPLSIFCAFLNKGLSIRYAKGFDRSLGRV